MADDIRNPVGNNDTSCDSHHSETYSFSYPGIQKVNKPAPNTIIRNAPSFRKPVRVISFMREALKKAELETDEKNSLEKHDVKYVAGNTNSLPDKYADIHLEPMPDMDSFSHTEHSDASIKSVNEDPNTFQGMGWLMESSRKDQKTLKIKEHQPENKPECLLLQHATQPTTSNHNYTNLSTPQNKQQSHLGVFKEISNSSALKIRSGINQNFKAPLKNSIENTALHNEKILCMSSSYSSSKTMSNSVKPPFSSTKTNKVDSKHITPSNHHRECDPNIRHQADTPFRSQQALHEIPIKPQATLAYGCPVKFSLHVAAPRQIDNQNKENDIQLSVGAYENVEVQNEEPLNLNLKDLTGHSEQQIDLKVLTKPNPTQNSHVSHHAHPIIHQQQHIQKPILPNVQTPSPTLDTLINDKPIISKANPAKVAMSSDNVMFSLPAAKAKSSSLTVNGKPYVIISQLGTGGSSKVYQVMENGSSATYAVKCVNLSNVDEAIARGYINEIELLKQLQHCDSVIRLLGYEYVKKTKTLLVVMEKGDTDFSNFLRDINKTKKISALMIAYYWSEMVTAVDNIHKYGIIHSDLKPPNFLLVSGRLKLIDFGIASSINVDMTSVVKDQMMGTFNYMSPEAIGALNNAGGANSEKRKITFKSDIWSLGCILYNLVYGRTPFAHINGIGKLVEIYNPNHEIKYPDVEYPPVLVEVIKRCLTYDPRLRPSTTELLQSPLLPKLEDPFLMSKIKSIVTPEMWSAINGNSST